MVHSELGDVVVGTLVGDVIGARNSRPGSEWGHRQNAWNVQPCSKRRRARHIAGISGIGDAISGMAENSALMVDEVVGGHWPLSAILLPTFLHTAPMMQMTQRLKGIICEVCGMVNI